MASLSLIDSLLSVFDSSQRRALSESFREVTRNMRVGVPTSSNQSENFSGAFYDVTTSTTANQEVAVPHGFGTAPYLLIPVLPLNSSGAQIVSLKTTQPADASYIYLASSVTGATVRCYVEV